MQNILHKLGLWHVSWWLWSFSHHSLAPGKFEWNFRHVIFKQILVIYGWGISCEIALIWMSLDFTDDQSTLVQVMAWCRQATSHYLIQCWPISLSPYGFTSPQWVNYTDINSSVNLIYIHESGHHCGCRCLTLNSASPSEATMMTLKLYTWSPMFLWLLKTVNISIFIIVGITSMKDMKC